MEKHSIFDLFVDISSNVQNKIAVIDEHESITYYELTDKINSIANNLLASTSTILENKQPIIAILIEPSVDFIATILACLKIGAAYIPLDINYPSDYLTEIISNTTPTVFVSDDKHLDYTLDLCTLNITELTKKATATYTTTPIINYNNRTAYIIYTSGTTGKSKGIKISHDNLLSLFRITQAIYNFSEEDVIPLFHSPAFDFSVWEIYSALLYGGTLAIPPANSRQNLESYAKFLIDSKASIINITPSAFYQLQEIICEQPKEFIKKSCIRTIITGGEKLTPKQLKPWFNLPIASHSKFYNMYGITEATIHATVKEITIDDTKLDYSPIGTPLPNLTYRVVKKDGSEAKTRETGELWIAGSTISSDYLNSSNNDENRSTPTLYLKTGDYVKKLDNNELAYVSRNNAWTKIRGHRINCNEIENKLLSLDTGITNVLVTTIETETNEHSLLACIEGQNIPSTTELIVKLKRITPEFMCPSIWKTFHNFPLTLNGKIAIEKLLATALDAQKNSLENNNKSIETIIANIWQELLQSNPDHNTNFFDAGGNSLLLVRLKMILQRRLGHKINIADLIRNPSIHKFALFLEDRKQ